MNFLAENIGWFIILLFFLGSLGVILTQGRDRFWMAPFGIWLFLIIFLFVGNALSSQPANSFGLQDPPVVRDQTTDENPVQSEEMKKTRQNFAHYAIKLVQFQSLFCLFWFLFGYKQTTLKFYKTGAISYFIISMICFIVTALNFV